MFTSAVRVGTRSVHGRYLYGISGGEKTTTTVCCNFVFFVILFLYTVNYSDETKVEIPRVAGLLTFTILRPLINTVLVLA